ncbi:Serine/threonine-protein kinase PknB [Minicystis rosea]|nr:Serine/threonine-protein kinase PknB [Minicystis rosea]
MTEWDPARRYRRLEILGVGGMGEVALCKDDWVDREVALKTIREIQADTAEARARFLREMRVQGRLEHPSIVPVYDFGVDAEGQMYFTMRRVRGQTLRQILTALGHGDEEMVRRYSRHKLLTAMVSVCLAVHYAHTQGVLHRDLKPSNIMLGEFGEVYVLDWGIAKLIEATAATEVTQDGATLGTPSYMSPEQLLGKRVIDARTDVYALGMIFFEVLALRALHTGRDRAEIAEATLTGLDARPSAYANDVPPELDAVCARATARDPAGRFGTAQEMAASIERFLEGDRDLERRREAATRHAESAARAAARATAADTEEPAAEAARAEAMSEVVQALTIDPTQTSATRTLVDLLVKMPEKMPAEVEKELQQADELSRREGAKMAIVTFAVWLSFAPVGPLIGVISWTAYAFTAGVTLVALCYALWLFRYGRLTQIQNYLLAGFAALSTGSLSVWAGPFMLVPIIAAVMTLNFVTLSMRRERLVLIFLGVLTVLVPFGLELAGIMSPSYAFEAGKLIVLPRAYRLSPGWTLGILAYTSVTWILFPPLILGRVRDALNHARRELFLHAWHFRRLLPDTKTSSAEPPTRS